MRKPKLSKWKQLKQEWDWFQYYVGQPGYWEGPDGKGKEPHKIVIFAMWVWQEVVPEKVRWIVHRLLRRCAWCGESDVRELTFWKPYYLCKECVVNMQASWDHSQSGGAYH